MIFTQSSSYNAGQIESLCIHLGYGEDVNADGNGAKLPASQPSFSHRRDFVPTGRQNNTEEARSKRR